MSDNDHTQATDQQSTESESEPHGLSLEAASDLASSSMKPDPFWFRFGDGLLHFLAKIILFVVGLLIDIGFGLFAIVKGVFVFLFKGASALGKTAVKVHRIFHDVDLWGKLTFLVNGLGNLVRKQWLDGFVFLGIQLLFNIFMFVPIKGVMMGYSNLENFFQLNDGAVLTKKYGLEYWTGSADARLAFINGLFTLLVIAAFVVVYVQAIKSMYDNYQIVHAMEFRAARENGIRVLTHQSEYEENLSELSRFKIKRLMRDKYGFDELSARYIAHVDFRHAADREPTFFYQRLYRLRHYFYRHYDVVRKKMLRHLDYFGPLERFLGGKEKPVHNPFGYEKILGNEQAASLRFRHTFDKYNDYFSTGRDQKALANVLNRGQELLDAVLARDALSVQNNVKPFALEGKLSVKLCVSGVVGYFGLPLDLARKATARTLKAIGAAKKTVTDSSQIEAAVLQTLKNEAESEKTANEAFEKASRTDVLRDADGAVYAYRHYGELRPFFDQGVKAFTSMLVQSRGLGEKRANAIYDDFAFAIKASGDQPPLIREMLEKRALRLEEGYAALIHTYPFHGQPTGFKKRIKEFGDEKFAVTVLSLPVMAAVITVIIPLLCSVFVAFTNWDQYHTNNRFVWSLTSFDQVLNLFNGDAGAASYAYTFFHLLQWTIIWAFFATFTNYFCGILLALMINRQSIKLKKVWRTIFVVTIAIPQFISLLAMSLLLSNDGAINTWLLTQGWYTQGMSRFFGWGSLSQSGAWIPSALPFLGGKNAGASDSFIPKLTVILVNMWVGIPYTMLSTSGILMNIPDDLYESSRIDGAGPARQLFAITMPYVFFVTGPALLTQFVGNINNFNVIFFLTNGEPSAINARMVAGAGETDLLITWLYKMTVNSKDYSIGAVIGILVFAVCAFFSLIIYKRLGSVKNEEEFQ